jgi:hypothetical protein
MFLRSAIKQQKGNNEKTETPSMQSLTSFRKPSLPNHDLYQIHKYEIGDIVKDHISSVTMEVIDETFLCQGIGKTKGRGIKVLDHVKKNTIFCWTEKPLIQMDLELYSQTEYEKNGWIIFGKRACPLHELPMLANTVAPLDADHVEQSNTKLCIGHLPVQLRPQDPDGLYGYLKSTRVIKPNTNAIIKKYGSGPHCLRWGQEPTLKRQKRNVIRFLESTEMLRRTKQKANKVCGECGIILPRMKNKRNAHNAICAKLKS